VAAPHAFSPPRADHLQRGPTGGRCQKARIATGCIQRPPFRPSRRRGGGPGRGEVGIGATRHGPYARSVGGHITACSPQVLRPARRVGMHPPSGRIRQGVLPCHSVHHVLWGLASKWNPRLLQEAWPVPPPPSRTSELCRKRGNPIEERILTRCMGQSQRKGRLPSIRSVVPVSPVLICVVLPAAYRFPRGGRMGHGRRALSGLPLTTLAAI
jgi:hypothetical protein